MSTLACICGANGWSQIAAFCQLRADWLTEVLAPEGGIPCADTFRRTISRIAPEQLQRAFVSWAVAAVGKDSAGHIAIDGKTARRSASPSKGTPAAHLISAWATDLGVVLAQRRVDAKSNELVAIPELLDALSMKDATITIDAMGCQREIAKKIRQKRGHYILQVKGNQPQLLEDLQGLFELAKQTPEHHVDSVALTHHESVNGDHGRIEKRTVTATDAVKWLRRENRWTGIRSAVMVEREREADGNVSYEKSYYISSHDADAQELGKLIRDHWSVENQLHWVLDMAFREDESRIRDGNGPENISMLYKVTLALLRLEKTGKGGLQLKRQQAGWSQEYLLTVLGAVATAHR